MFDDLSKKIEKGKVSRRKFITGLGLAAGAAAIGRFPIFAQGGPIQIGALFTFTGALASFGPDFENAARLAADHINAAGGPLGRQIELLIRDSGTNPDVGRAAAERLVNIDRVPAIVGALSSGVSQAVSSVTIAGRVVQISPASTSVALTDLDDKDFFFRTTLSDVGQGPIQARAALDLGFKKVSVIYVNNPYGKGLAELFRQKFEEGRGQVLSFTPYEESKASYRGEVQRLLQGNPDAINLIGYPTDGNKILIQAAELGFDGKILLTDGMESEDAVANGPAGSFLNGRAFGTTHGALETSAGERYFSAFEEKYGKKPDPPFTPQTYDAVAVIALAIAKSGRDRITGAVVRNNLRDVANAPGEKVSVGDFDKAFDLIKRGRDVDYVGASGPLDFDSNGDVKVGEIVVWKIENGKRVKTSGEKVEL